MVFCVSLAIALLGVAFLLWNALLGIAFLLWHLPWLQLVTSSATAALASLLVQAWLADCSRFYAHVLLWPAAWILICLPWSSYPAQWAVWVLCLSTAFSFGPMLSSMLAQAWLADCRRFYAHVLLWVTAWSLICFPWSLHPGQWAVWVLFLSTAFSLGPTLSWLCDQKHEKPVPYKQKPIKGRQLKILHRRQLARALKPVRVPSLKV